MGNGEKWTYYTSAHRADGSARPARARSTSRDQRYHPAFVDRYSSEVVVNRLNGSSQRAVQLIGKVFSLGEFVIIRALVSQRDCEGNDQSTGAATKSPKMHDGRSGVGVYNCIRDPSSTTRFVGMLKKSVALDALRASALKMRSRQRENAPPPMVGTIFSRERK